MSETATAPAEEAAAPAAAAPSKPVIAGGMPNVAAKPAADAAATPNGTATPAANGAFDWKGSIPEGAPTTLGRFKTWEEADKGFRAKDSEINRLKNQIKGTPQVTQDNWNQAFQNFHQTGEIDETLIEALEKTIAMPKSFALRVFEMIKQDREAFVESAKPELGNIPYKDVEEWLNSGESPFSENARAGFTEFMAMGDASWLKLVVPKYREAHGIPEQSVAQQPLQRQPNSPNAAPPHGTRPSRVTSKGYASLAESRAAFNAAMASGDTAAMAAHEAKLMQTPDHILQAG